MQKNTVMAVVLSTAFLLLWWMFFMPKPTVSQSKVQTNIASVLPETAVREIKGTAGFSKETLLGNVNIPEQEIIVETDKYKAVFTNKGAAVKNWYIKEENGQLTDIVLYPESSCLSTFPGSNFEVSKPSKGKVVFSHLSPEGWKLVKTYDLSDGYLHKLDFALEKTRSTALLPDLMFGWGPGMGTDVKELKENNALIRAYGLLANQPAAIEKFKNKDYSPLPYNWAAIDNRYFLAAFIFENPADFSKITVAKSDKSHPFELVLSAAKIPSENRTKKISLQLFLGPKKYNELKTYGLGLEQSVDFGFFGFLGKGVLSFIHFLQKYTHNYGWAIIILTIIMQIIVAPLTFKSFKATAAMKKLQPHIKALQEKFKSDPKRLNTEVLNLYRTQKVNPLGGCLPLILQMPIFWALFTTLRNAYELRGAGWILWVKDLSAPDAIMSFGAFNLNILPLVMGLGMFVQQKMMAVSTDPMQQRMMYLMPVIFTAMFWGFPSGLVLYWLVNSIMTMLEQYWIMKREDKAEVAKNG